MKERKPVETEGTEQRRGMNIFLILAVLTLVEYAVAVSLSGGALLIVLLVIAAVAKCWAIVTYFMHVSHLWRGEEAH